MSRGKSKSQIAREKQLNRFDLQILARKKELEDLNKDVNVLKTIRKELFVEIKDLRQEIANEIAKKPKDTNALATLAAVAGAMTPIEMPHEKVFEIHAVDEPDLSDFKTDKELNQKKWPLGKH